MVDGRYAAIDIGTVTCRLMVADVRSGAVRPVAKEYRITNLGEGVDASRMLAPAAMQRVEDAVRGFLRVRDGLDAPAHPVLATMAVATSAARDAQNAADFEAMLARLGVQLAVIPGAQEAALTFAGATAAHAGQRVMVVDVGGGSTELSIGQGGAAPEASHSFDIGCRRMTERYLAADPPAADQLQEAYAWAHGQFKAWLQEAAAAGAALAERMVAVAGTATTAVSIREQMAVYDSARVDGAVVTEDDLRRIADRLAALPLDARRQVVGLDPGRAPVIVAGMLILLAVMEAAGMRAFTASESDILDGMILHCANAQQ